VDDERIVLPERDHSIEADLPSKDGFIQASSKLKGPFKKNQEKLN
jgi:hypothetical protein